MPRQSLEDLRNALTSVPEMTAEHRVEVMGLVDALAKEVEQTDEASAGTEHLKGALAVAEEVVRRRAGAEADEEHDLTQRIAELEDKAEMVAVEYPVIAQVLTAISRLI
jgi:hypothetical protein